MWASAIMTIAGALALISSIGMGIMTSQTVQTGLYSAGLTALDAMKAAAPAWLVGKGDLDNPIEFLTDGPVADAIVEATLAFKDLEVRVKPRLQLVTALNAATADLAQRQQNLQIAAGLLWHGLEGAAWRKARVQRLEEMAVTADAAAMAAAATVSWVSLPAAREAAASWQQGNRTAAAAARKAAERLQAGDLDEVLNACNQTGLTDTVRSLEAWFAGKDQVISLSFIGGGLSLDSVEPGLAADFLRIESAMNHTGVTSRLLRFLEYRLKDRLAVEPRLKALQAATEHERTLTAYREYWDWESSRAAKVAKAGAHLRNDPIAATAFEEFLTGLQSWGYDFPEDIGRKVRGTARLSRRALARLVAVAEFRRAPSRWITVFIVSVFLGVVGFGLGVCYSMAFIINMGILGTVRNLMGIVYVRSEGALRRAQIEEQRSVLALRDLSPSRTLQDRDGRQHAD